MKGLRKAALGLAVVACLLSAVPAAQAGPMDTPLMLTSVGSRVAGWFARLAARFDWGGSGPSPTPSCDHGSGMDPNGTPCKP
jgi:hypothetical protein